MVFLALLIAAAPAASSPAVPSDRLRVNECADRTAPGCQIVKQSPYRLPLPGEAKLDMKQAAFAQDGTDCETDAKRCPSKTRTIFRTTGD